MRDSEQKLQQQSGNALFLILIAVALFAALSWAVTQSSRSSGDALKEERFISSAQLTQIGADMQQAALRMTLTGTNINDILLHDQTGPDQTLPCTSGDTCLFAPEGGAAVFPKLPQHIEKGSWNPPNFLFFEIADGGKVTGVANGQPVLLMLVRDLHKDVCTDINKGLGISNVPSQLLWQMDAGQMVALPGKLEGCANTQGTVEYVYYHVLGLP